MAWSGYSEKGNGSEERGPASFALRSPGAVQAQGTQAVGPRDSSSKVADITGVSLTPTAPADRTFEFLAGVAKEAVAPKVEQMRQTAFLTGMQQAASGEALVDIVNTQPWYSKIFGDSPLVEGARAFSVQAGVNKFIAEQDANMGTLRQMDPSQIPEVMTGAMNKLKTGDGMADMMLQGEIVKHMPDLIRRQTRENYKFKQEQAVEKRVTAWQGTSSSLQAASMADPGLYLPDELDRRKGNFLSSLIPTAGADLDSWATSLIDFTKGVAESGEFHSIQAMREAGIFQYMKAKDRTVVEKALTAYERQHAAASIGNYSPRLAKLQFDAANGNVSAAEVEGEYDAIDLDYQRRSGNSLPLIPRTSRVGTEMSAMQAVARAQKEQAKAILKQQGTEDTKARIQTFLVGAGTSKDAINEGLKSHDVDMAAREYFQSLPTAEAKVQFLVNDARGERPISFIQSDINVMVNSAASDNVTDAFKSAYGLWSGLRAAGPGGDNASMLYFGNKGHQRMQAFHNALGGKDVNEFGELAFQTSLTQRMDPGYTLNKDEVKLATAYIDNEVRGNKWYKFGVDQLTESAKRAITNSMSGTVGSLKNVTSGDRLMPDAYAAARAAGLEQFGKHAWQVDSLRPRLQDYFVNATTHEKLPVTTREIGQALNGVVDEKVKAITGKTPNDIMVLRAADSNGKANFILHVVTDDGVMAPTTFDSDELTQFINSGKYKATQKPITMQSLPGAPDDPTAPYVGYRRPTRETTK